MPAIAEETKLVLVRLELPADVQRKFRVEASREGLGIGEDGTSSGRGMDGRTNGRGAVMATIRRSPRNAARRPSSSGYWTGGRSRSNTATSSPCRRTGTAGASRSMRAGASIKWTCYSSNRLTMRTCPRMLRRRPRATGPD